MALLAVHTHSAQSNSACISKVLTDSSCKSGGYLKVSKRNLYCWRMAGLVPYFKIGRAVRFMRFEVDAALERLRMGAP